MIWLALSIATMLGVCWLLAWAFSGKDTADILLNIVRGDRRELNHSPMALMQWGAVLACAVGCCAIAALPWMNVLWYVGIGYGFFTPEDRKLLNRKRGYPMNYVAPGNWYDRLFIRMAWRKEVRPWPGKASMVKFHAYNYHTPGGLYRDWIHMAGRWTYNVEYTSLAFSLAGLITYFIIKH